MVSTDKTKQTNETSRNKTVENQVKAGIAGGIEAIVRLINTHIDSVDVCVAGCDAIMNMTTNNCKFMAAKDSVTI